MKAKVTKTDGGLPENVVGAMAYLLGPLLLLTVKKNGTVKFHAWQATMFGVAAVAGWVILMKVPVIGWVLLPFWTLVVFVFWLVAMVKTLQKEKFKMPVLGDWVDKMMK